MCGQSIVVQPNAIFHSNIQFEQVLPNVVASAHSDVMFLFVPVNLDLSIALAGRAKKVQFIESLPVGIEV